MARVDLFLIYNIPNWNISLKLKIQEGRLFGSNTIVVNLTPHNPSFHNIVLPSFMQFDNFRNTNNTFYRVKLQTNIFTIILSYASWILFSIWKILLVTTLLTCLGPVKEASFHCISCKLSKPRSHIRFFPTWQKKVITHLASDSDAISFLAF